MVHCPDIKLLIWKKKNLKKVIKKNIKKVIKKNLSLLLKKKKKFLSLSFMHCLLSYKVFCVINSKIKTKCSEF